MSLRDAKTLAGGAVVESEVAIVGAGPAGLALAGALAAAGLDVVLLESGGLGSRRAASEPLELRGGESDAAFRRDRRFGGTLWYGRCVAPDPIDFAPRAWVPGSGWPIPYAAVAVHLERAARWLGLEQPAGLDSGLWRDEAAFRLLDGGGLAPRVHLISRRKDLGRRHRRAVAAEGRIRALLGATLVGFDLAPADGRVERARFAAADGAERAVRAGAFVLACGALESTRQLLLLDEEFPGRLGPSAALLGEGFFDHPRCDGVARLHLDSAAPQAAELHRGLLEHDSPRARCRVQLAASIAAERQRDEGLLNPCGFFYPLPLRRLAALGGVSLVLAAAAARARRRPFRSARLALVEQLEQAPAEAGRLELAAARDRFGRRRLRATWSVGEATCRTQRRFHELLAERVRATGAGRLASPLLDDPDARPAYGDAAHPMGTTRLAADPSRGVVDLDARVHAIDNLWVAGTSLFPTCGNVNPTLTLVAMAFRLAEHLARRARAARLTLSGEAS